MHYHVRTINTNPASALEAAPKYSTMIHDDATARRAASVKAKLFPSLVVDVVPCTDDCE